MIVSTEADGECILTGGAVSAGVAIGPAYVHHDILDRVQLQYTVTTQGLDQEWQRLCAAIQNVDRDLKHSADRVERELGRDMAVVFEAHRAMVHDPSLSRDFKQALESRRVNVEEIVKSVLTDYERRVRSLENGVLSERADDIADLSRRLLRVLAGIRIHCITSCPRGSVIVAKHLLPSECVHLNQLNGCSVSQTCSTDSFNKPSV